MLKLWQFTDLHLHVREDRTQIDTRPGQTALAQSSEIIDACLAAFLAEPDCGILLLTGDLTQTGHPEEHREMVRKLAQVQGAAQALGLSKRVIAITASHDYKTIGAENSPQLREMYRQFGLDDAIAQFDRGLAFVMQLAPGVRLLCVNGHARMQDQSPPWLPWALEQIDQAKRAGDCIFGMTHHPSLPPSAIYPLLSPRSMFDDYKATTRALADAGLRFILTGHSHFHNIEPAVTPAGNPYWDINTSALVGWPGKFREVRIEDGRAQITSREIPYVSAFGDLSAREFLKNAFGTLLCKIFDGWDHDYDVFAHSIGSIGIKAETAYKRKRLLHPAGKLVNRITLGGLGHLLLCGHKIPKEARKVPLRDIFIELVLNMYAGEEPYGPETGVGKAFLAYGRRLGFLGKKLGVGDFGAFLLSMVYDSTPDDAITFELG